jgi:hypothetical protein
MKEIDWPKRWLRMGIKIERDIKSDPYWVHHLCLEDKFRNIMPILGGKKDSSEPWWSGEEEGNYGRATFCYFMAAMGDEFEGFLEWCKEN